VPSLAIVSAVLVLSCGQSHYRKLGPTLMEPKSSRNIGGAATGYTGCTAPFLAGEGTRRYIDLDKFSVYQFSPMQSSCIRTSMSIVFPILHISFTAILPAITLFNDYVALRRTRDVNEALKSQTETRPKLLAFSTVRDRDRDLLRFPRDLSKVRLETETSRLGLHP